MGERLNIYLVAGEPSGDRLGAALMAGLSTLVPGARFFGVGGSEMEAAGMKSLFPMSDLSVMGIAEVLPKLRGLFRRRDEVVADVLRQEPDVLVTIDSPDFCLRVARKVKEARDIPVIHYVAPTVWAWRPKRVDKMKGVVDHVLALFPFEPPYMEAAGIECTFVGHPIVAEPQPTTAEAKAFREEHGFGDAPLLLVLPGSRAGEVARLTDVFGSAFRMLQVQDPALRAVIPTTEATAALVTEQTMRWTPPPLILDPRAEDPIRFRDQKRAAFGAADVAVAASGTVSLELAAAGAPMVIGYDMNWFSRFMIGRLLKIDTVTLVNLVSETRAVPEYLGAQCTPNALSSAVGKLLSDPDARKEQFAAFDITMTRLGEGQEVPGLRAAKALLTHLGKDKATL